MIRRAADLLLKSNRLRRGNLQWMSKGGKPAGKEEAAPEPVVEVLTPEEELRKYLTFGQKSISPSEQQFMEEQFEDISPEEKKMLHSLADQIVSLKTRTFRELEQWGGLGTSESFYTASQQLSEEELMSSIRRLRKEE